MDDDGINRECCEYRVGYCEALVKVLNIINGHGIRAKRTEIPMLEKLFAVVKGERESMLEKMRAK